MHYNRSCKETPIVLHVKQKMSIITYLPKSGSLLPPNHFWKSADSITLGEMVYRNTLSFTMMFVNDMRSALVGKVADLIAEHLRTNPVTIRDL